MAENKQAQQALQERETLGRNYTGRNRPLAIAPVLGLGEVAVGPLEAHRQSGDCLAPAVVDLAKEAEPSVQLRLVLVEVVRERQFLATQGKWCRQHWTLVHASEHLCGGLKSQYRCRSLPHTR